MCADFTAVAIRLCRRCTRRLHGRPRPFGSTKITVSIQANGVLWNWSIDRRSRSAFGIVGVPRSRRSAQLNCTAASSNAVWKATNPSSTTSSPSMMVARTRTRRRNFPSAPSPLRSTDSQPRSPLANIKQVVLPEEGGGLPNPKRPPREFRVKMRWANNINMEQVAEYIRGRTQLNPNILTGIMAVECWAPGLISITCYFTVEPEDVSWPVSDAEELVHRYPTRSTWCSEINLRSNLPRTDDASMGRLTASRSAAALTSGLGAMDFFFDRRIGAPTRLAHDTSPPSIQHVPVRSCGVWEDAVEPRRKRHCL
ncbi:MAG: hypothetical protein BJ554DRAFT_681 [Olpidium bornovanus]|uniref:Uncharacterized protein n=1 Tax=Olpidium bornovanus TaxID=278681 RepID=A0A8H8DM15_9FUNG|nr:MAG: hypothetical protein BJ554DRAFT_681 [Olpidium bornovanus]